MTDYSEHGAVPVEDAAVDDPPTVDEVLERQRREHPEQAAVDAGGHVVGTSDGEPEIEGPNSA